MRRSDLWLIIGGALAGALFFAAISTLWPLVPGDLQRDAAFFAPRAQPLSPVLGTDLSRYRVASRLRVDDPALTYVERAFGDHGRERARACIRDGLPLAYYLVTFKQRGSADPVKVELLSDGRVLGWERTMQEDAPARALGAIDAEAVARGVAGIGGVLGLDLDAYKVKDRSTRERPNRVDHQFTFERAWTTDEEPELRERLELTVSGDRVTKAWRTVVVPAAAERDARARRAPVETVQAFGFAALAAGALAALAVLLVGLGRGEVRLRQAVAVVVVAGCMELTVDALQQAALFERWDPLWPRWMAMAKDLAYDAMEGLSMLLPLLAFVAAGDALDRKPSATGLPGAQRGASLWALGRGELRDPAVTAASLRGFLVGALCGGTLALGVLLALGGSAGARTALQPRGFFFFPINSAMPALTTLCFFAQIALFEELGYRFFAGTWLKRLTGRTWLAIIIPGAVYGLCHTAYDFLPPADPWWARPLIMTAVGCVWGWAFFRYDALTVVLSHLTADLFIFNWPRLASGDAYEATIAALTISVPLWPAAIGILWRRHRPLASTETNSQ